MCKVLKISRTVYYYERQNRKVDTNLENMVIQIFNASRKNYGTRKIRMELRKHEIHTSRRKIARIMAQHVLVSSYTMKQYKVTRSECNNDSDQNIVNRKFNDRASLEVTVSDLIYINVAGKNKDAELIYKAFTTV
jgi:putative transposase